MKYTARPITDKEWAEVYEGVQIHIEGDCLSLFVYEDGIDVTIHWTNSGEFKGVVSEYIKDQTAKMNLTPLGVWLKVNGMPLPNSVSVFMGEYTDDLSGCVQFAVEWEE